MLISKDDIRIEDEDPIEKLRLIAKHEGLTGTVQLHVVIRYQANRIFYLSSILNGKKPKGQYFRTYGPAILRYEILKKKII